METAQLQLIKHYIGLAIRRRVIIGVCFLLGVSAGLAFYLLQPKTYQSSALLSYEQQKVSPNRMSPEDQKKIQNIVSTLTQIVTSRT